MTSLSNYLNCLSEDNSVKLFQELFSREYKVSVNWLGSCVVEIDGYKGTELVDKISAVFLSSITKPYERLSLKEKLDYCELWGKLDQMYQSTTRGYWYPSEIQKVIQGAQENGLIGKVALLFFTEESYFKHWPNSISTSICQVNSRKASLKVGWGLCGKTFSYYSYTKGNSNSVEYYIATEKDIRQLLEKKKD